MKKQSRRARIDFLPISAHHWSNTSGMVYAQDSRADLRDMESLCTLRIDLERACRRLTERQMAMLGLWLEGYTQEELGEMLKTSQAQVSRDLAVIFATLRSELDGW